jgi:Tfp pilus assembly protein PilE
VTFFSFPRHHRGIALLNLVYLVMLIGALTLTGMKMYGSIVERKHANATRENLENAVRMITTWAVTNGRLPTAAEYPGLFGGVTPPVDAWGQAIRYIYDTDLTTVNSGGLCGRTKTALTCNGATDNAFALVSGGTDLTLRSKADATLIAASRGAASFAPDPSDLYRVVTLAELKSKGGCYGATGGSGGGLRIVNNELPNGCTNSLYTATIFGDGGVAPFAKYSSSGLPAGLTRSGATLSGIPTQSGVSSVTVMLRDSQTPTANTILRTFVLNIANCAGNLITFTVPPTATVTSNWNGGVAGDQGTSNNISYVLNPATGTLNAFNSTGNRTSCIWYQQPINPSGRGSCTP